MTDFSNRQIDTHSLPDAEEIEYQSVLPLYHKGLIISTLLSWGSIALAATITGVVLEWAWFFVLILVAICLILMIGNLCILGKAYRYRGYAIREHDIHARRGIIKGTRASIPYKRIQQVAIEQSVVARYLGYHNLVVWTSSMGIGEITINGLERTEAERIKAYILAQIRNDEQP